MSPGEVTAAKLELFDTVATLQTTRPLTDYELTALKQLVSEYMKFRSLKPGCVVVNPSRPQEGPGLAESLQPLWSQLEHLDEDHMILLEDARTLNQIDRLLEEAAQ